MEELVLHAKSLPPSAVEDLIKMARNRASKGAKLSSITIINTSEEQMEEVFKLREYVTRVEYRVGGVRPAWD